MIGAVQPWQAVLLVLGAIGPLLALLLVLTVREPPRLASPVPRTTAEWRQMDGRWAAALLLATGFSLLSLSGYASSAELPSYFVRTHGWSAAAFGMVYGAIVMLFGGWLTDRWSAAGQRDAALRVGVAAAAGSTAIGLGFLLPVDSRLAAAMIAPAAFTIAMPGGAWAAGLRQLVPASMLGRMTAVCLLLMTLLGLGLGPTLVGWLSHRLQGGTGTLALPLLIVCGGSQLLGGLVLWGARWPYLRTSFPS